MCRLLLVTALALGACVAQASNGVFYFGAGVTNNHVHYSEHPGFDSSFNDIDNSTSWQLFAGFRPINLFAIEANYLDLGSHAKRLQIPPSVGYRGGSFVRESDAKAFAAYAVGFLPVPLPNLEVYGKAGLASYKLNDTVTASSPGLLDYSQAYPENDAAFTWGAGVQAHVGNVGGRLEYDGFDTASTSVVSLSLYLNLK